MKEKQATAVGVEPVLEFLEVAASLKRRLDRALGQIHGISFSEYRLLRALASSTTAMREGALSRIELAQAVGLTASAITRALKPLEKLGYVKTEPSKRDARASLAVINSVGLKLLNNAETLVSDVVQQLPFGKQSAQQRKSFAGLLNQFKDA